MKRYMLFAGDCYYPSGGMEDFVMSSNVLDVLMTYASKNIASGAWYHIYDTVDMTFIKP